MGYTHARASVPGRVVMIPTWWASLYIVACGFRCFVGVRASSWGRLVGTDIVTVAAPAIIFGLWLWFMVGAELDGVPITKVVRIGQILGFTKDCGSA